MKSKRLEILYLVLSITVLVFAGFVYLNFKDRYQIATDDISESSYTYTIENNEEDIQAEIQDFEEALAKLEETPNAETLANLQQKLNQSEIIADKAPYQEKLDAISVELTNQTSAQTAVATAESYQSIENLQSAQAAVQEVQNESVKTDLQNRLKVVESNIQSYIPSQPGQ